MTKHSADIAMQFWEESLEPDTGVHSTESSELSEAQALIESLAKRSGHLVHDMNNGLTRMLGRTNLALEDMEQTGAPCLDDLEALRRISRELADLSRSLMKEVVVPARRYARERKE